VAPRRPRNVQDRPKPASGGPRGLEPRTCGSRVRSEGAGQRAARLVSCAFASQWYPSFPIASRSFTGTGRGHDARRRCHFGQTAAISARWQRLIEPEQRRGIVSRLDLDQPSKIRSVVRASPVLEIGIREVRKDAARSPWVDHLPGIGGPCPGPARSATEASASMTLACFRQNSASRCTKAVASAGTRL
jgi:hypothetical protein